MITEQADVDQETSQLQQELVAPESTELSESDVRRLEVSGIDRS